MPERIRILWINPTVENPAFDKHIKEILQSIKRPDVTVHVTSLPKGPKDLEYWSNLSVILSDLYKTVYDAEQNITKFIKYFRYCNPGEGSTRTS